jgi:CheY-like chemotaxis protein
MAPAPAASAAPASERSAEPVELEATGRPLQILLADDHPTNRKVVEVLLSGFDVALVTVENGAQACEAFEAGTYDVVLMDMQMPVMDGLTATRTIRAYEKARGASRPALVVMLTANALPEHQAAARDAGADIHLPKPITAARLFEAISRAEPAAGDQIEAFAA